MSGTATVSQCVVQEIAKEEGIDPLELRWSLYGVIDPDALNSLFQSTATKETDTKIIVEFNYHDYTVRVEDGDVHVIKPARATES
ncbi:HalOD1 output domain-containing protein [Natrononativus amylolyticus]|uniref:HalOD1 output domain-containing protein n=1 Tax=Natrononativus amylolyticus TaxID=2963434 RepID=UPI0020CD7C15|nr:HalOD1 output domain-containing protein [Natrononativus amylolyticus]